MNIHIYGSKHNVMWWTNTIVGIINTYKEHFHPGIFNPIYCILISGVYSIHDIDK